MKQYEERIFKLIMIGASLIILGILVYIVGTIFYKGLPALTWDMISKVPEADSTWARKAESLMPLQDRYI